MKTYEFSIVVSGLDHTADNFETLFYEGDCSDAAVSYQRRQIIVDFAREDENYDKAVESAVADLNRMGAIVESITLIEN